MVVLYGLILGLFLLLFCLAKWQGVGVSAYLYEWGRKKGMFGHEDIRNNIRLLQPDSGGRAEREGVYLRRFYISKIKLLLQMIFIGNLFALCLFIKSGSEHVLKDGKYIIRNAYGMGNTETNLQVRAEDENGMAGHQEFTFIVEEQQYEEILVKQMADRLVQDLPDMILGCNSSLEEVRADLNLMREAEGYPFRIEWESNDYSCIDSDGSIMNEGLKEEGKVLSLTAALIYGTFQEEYIFPVHIFPPLYTQEEKFKKKVYEMLILQEERNRCEEQVELPEQVEGRKLIWSEKKEEESGTIFFLICIAAAVVYFLRDRELRDKVEARNRQMLLDYPQLVSRVALYIGAGMTVRNVFRKIAGDYQKEKKAGGEMHYAYEEMLLTCHELDSGISESAAYEHFGRRCRMIQYMKFSNLLVQNLKKGSNGILEALRQEAKNAFEDRRNMARKLGEEAGTKLLLPMMLMLGIVMVLIIIPAYFSFSV